MDLRLGAARRASRHPADRARRALRLLTRELRGAFAAVGSIEVHVCTPLPVCRARDQKGLYARLGDNVQPEIVSPFEVPDRPDYRIDTSDTGADEAAAPVVARLVEMAG